MSYLTLAECFFPPVLSRFTAILLVLEKPVSLKLTEWLATESIRSTLFRPFRHFGNLCQVSRFPLTNLVPRAYSAFKVRLPADQPPTFTLFSPRLQAEIFTQWIRRTRFEVFLRLLPTFAGSLREKIRTCAGFNKIPTNYISEESLINGVYDKSIV